MTLDGVLDGWRWSARNAALSALAAVISWWLAVWLTGDPRPVSAAVAAIVALSPGIPNPRLQIVGFVVGFATGLALGWLVRPLVAADPTVSRRRHSCRRAGVGTGG